MLIHAVGSIGGVETMCHHRRVPTARVAVGWNGSNNVVAAHLANLILLKRYSVGISLACVECVDGVRTFSFNPRLVICCALSAFRFAVWSHNDFAVLEVL